MLSLKSQNGYGAVWVVGGAGDLEGCWLVTGQGWLRSAWFDVVYLPPGQVQAINTTCPSSMIVFKSNIS